MSVHSPPAMHSTSQRQGSSPSGHLARLHVSMALKALRSAVGAMLGQRCLHALSPLQAVTQLRTAAQVMGAVVAVSTEPLCMSGRLPSPSSNDRPTSLLPPLAPPLPMTSPPPPPLPPAPALPPPA